MQMQHKSVGICGILDRRRSIFCIPIYLIGLITNLFSYFNFLGNGVPSMRVNLRDYVSLNRVENIQINSRLIVLSV